MRCRVGVVGTSHSVSFSVAYLKMAGATGTWPKRKADCWRDEKKGISNEYPARTHSETKSAPFIALSQVH